MEEIKNNFPNHNLNYDDIITEDIVNEYIKNLPPELNHIPRCVVENWILRHRDDFFKYWDNLTLIDLSSLSFNLKTYSNEEILKIKDIDEEETLKWMDMGFDSIQNYRMNRKPYYVFEYILKNGTFPCPIIVWKGAKNIPHHRCYENDFLNSSYQIIEGYRRWRYLSAMILDGSFEINDNHQVWEIKEK